MLDQLSASRDRKAVAFVVHDSKLDDKGQSVAERPIESAVARLEFGPWTRLVA